MQSLFLSDKPYPTLQLSQESSWVFSFFFFILFSTVISGLKSSLHSSDVHELCDSHTRTHTDTTHWLGNLASDHNTLRAYKILVHIKVQVITIDSVTWLHRMRNNSWPNFSKLPAIMYIGGFSLQRHTTCMTFYLIKKQKQNAVAAVDSKESVRKTHKGGAALPTPVEELFLLCEVTSHSRFWIQSLNTQKCDLPFFFLFRQQ